MDAMSADDVTDDTGANDGTASRVGLGPGATLAYESRGSGIPLVAFHGAYSSRREVSGFLEPMLAGRSVKRIYVDLPGHGESRPSGSVESPDDVLDLVDLMLGAKCPEGPFLLLGHSWGAHFARAVAARHPGRVAGLALICAFVPGEQKPAAPTVVRDDAVSAALTAAEREEFEGYFVVRTRETLERFRHDVAPAGGDVDTDTLEKAIDAAPLRVDPDAVVVDAPVLAVSGRNDSWVGWERQEALGHRYPRATVVTVADAGHALPHERPELVAALLGDWLDQIDT